MITRRTLLSALALLPFANSRVALAGLDGESTMTLPAVEIAKFYLFDSVEDLTPVSGGGSMQFSHVTMSPGIYAVGNQSFDCTRAGLYRFKLEGEAFFRNRIVGGDLYALISAVSWNTVQGVAHEGGAMQAVSDLGRYLVWRMRCGYTGNYCSWLLPQYGYQVRQVGVISSPSDRNGYDDGHQVIEVMHAGKWRMFDVTSGCYWRNAAGDHLSTEEFIAHIANNGPMPEYMPLDGNQRRWSNDTITLPNGLMDLMLYGRYIDDVVTREGWMRRVFHQADVQ